MSPVEGTWRLWVDTGGTFTDCIATAPDGRRQGLKVLSDSSLRARVESLESPKVCRLEFSMPLCDGFLDGYRVRVLGGGAEAGIVSSDRSGRIELDGPLGAGIDEMVEVRFDVEVPILAAAIATGTPPRAVLPPISMRLATTRATNALLERSGAPTALVTTRGFADLLAIGTQQRDDLFTLDIRRPDPFHDEVFEVEERLDASGREVVPLDAAAADQVALRVAAAGYGSAAVAFLHSHVEARHEIELERRLRTAGVRYVSRSSEVAPLQGALSRAQTAVVDAYLAPAIEDYLREVEEPLRDSRLRVMTSAGGLGAATEVRAKDCLLSGPAGGVVGAARAAESCGVGRLISFDMGGTSTDVARYDGELDYRFETRMAGVRVLAPALAIETVAAGGGSICRFDGRQLRVGPQSAGARPGPACYGAGGPLTLTDVNLLLGRLDAGRFEIPLRLSEARRRLDGHLEEIALASEPVDADTALLGWLRIADERMAEAIRRISVRHGYDPAEYTLVTFGGAGGQHACSVARLLGMRSVLMPSDASLLSAWGLGHAVLERIVERQVLELAQDAENRFDDLLDELANEALEGLAAEGVERGEARIRRILVLARLEGQDATLSLDHRRGEPVATTFRRTYLELFGYEPPDRRIEIESVRLVASSRRDPAPPEEIPRGDAAPVAEERNCRLDGAWGGVPVHVREELPSGAWFVGPALVVERFATLVVDRGWRGRVVEGGALRLDRTEEAE